MVPLKVADVMDEVPSPMVMSPVYGADGSLKSTVPPMACFPVSMSVAASM